MSFTPFLSNSSEIQIRDYKTIRAHPLPYRTSHAVAFSYCTALPFNAHPFWRYSPTDPIIPYQSNCYTSALHCSLPLMPTVKAQSNRPFHTSHTSALHCSLPLMPTVKTQSNRPFHTIPVMLLHIGHCTTLSPKYTPFVKAQSNRPYHTVPVMLLHSATALLSPKCTPIVKAQSNRPYHTIPVTLLHISPALLSPLNAHCEGTVQQTLSYHTSHTVTHRPCTVLSP